jgi:hypothetical protein
MFDKQSRFNDKLSSLSINIANIANDPKLLKEATEILSAFERLSVGINTNIFDFDIIERMTGSYLVFMYARFNPYIENIRRDATRSKSYIEFERVVHKLKRNRTTQDDSGIIS